jgi:hypothetical protein
MEAHHATTIIVVNVAVLAVLLGIGVCVVLEIYSRKTREVKNNARFAKFQKKVKKVVGKQIAHAIMADVDGSGSDDFQDEEFDFGELQQKQRRGHYDRSKRRRNYAHQQMENDYPDSHRTVYSPTTPRAGMTSPSLPHDNRSSMHFSEDETTDYSGESDFDGPSTRRTQKHKSPKPRSALAAAKDFGNALLGSQSSAKPPKKSRPSTPEPRDSTASTPEKDSKPDPPSPTPPPTLKECSFMETAGTTFKQNMLKKSKTKSRTSR